MYAAPDTGGAGAGMQVPVDVSTTGDPSTAVQLLAPMLIVTLPVGAVAPAAAVTAAVTEIGCPNTATAGLTVVTAVVVATGPAGFTV